MTDVQDVRAQLTMEPTPSPTTLRYRTPLHWSLARRPVRLTLVAGPNPGRKHEATAHQPEPQTRRTLCTLTLQDEAAGDRQLVCPIRWGSRLSRDQHIMRVRPSRSCPHDQRCGGRFRSWIGESDDQIPGSISGSSRTPVLPGACPTLVIA